jgi:hypothetical protein
MNLVICPSLNRADKSCSTSSAGSTSAPVWDVSHADACRQLEQLAHHVVGHRPPGGGDTQLLPSGRALYRHSAAAAGVTNFLSSATFVLASVWKLSRNPIVALSEAKPGRHRATAHEVCGA